MEVIRFENYDYTSNTYVIISDEKTYIIDPGSKNMTKVLEYIKENDLNLTAVLLTHGHFDHILGLPMILEYKNVTVYIHENEKEFLYNGNLSLLLWAQTNQSYLTPCLENANIVTLKDGDRIDKFEIIHTPGHTNGGICYYNKEEKIIFTGDTLFKNTYGRVDLPTGDSEAMWKSIAKILKLERDTIIYPGHGDSTTVAMEYSFYYSAF
ncbi:MBL fold metallo-hydrolase [Streptobacillus moniliformis]|uniref:Beta-lactamase domain protein n=1 Tax=Streptobacillus moniliformis (strain ATCC 14647 / DSM 12112 / NCTC 10651 / 9901) TaxID=519441 RepID=D1AX98_STRM9|nr:MBL fold metallo-hydrolase [Streptobacillus moniliformis]ACZ00924.1 beta-lactamase domain protein [Streptobacillus moniliformis DSM 12112]AVL42691.1 MBL fold metallo-hydrolase [Streptobacillus moniliformis]QXW65725.1 MBL fold metallo-hydrolase [Streptobacillus moniliformis]SQA13937.1 hydroxyacylglutathione hydrolase [Streptobacillus moniliformis]